MFKTQAEIYQALLDGKAIRNRTDKDEPILKLKDGFVCSISGEKEGWGFTCPKDWQIVEEPKPPRKLYAYEVFGDGAMVYYSREIKTSEGSRLVRAPKYDIEFKD